MSVLKYLTLGVVGAALALAPVGSAGAATTVRQAGFKVIDLAMPYIAKSKGFFEQNGIDWEYVEIDSGKLGVAALLSGDVEFVDLGLDDVAALQANGKDPIGIYSMVNSLTMDLVLSKDAMAKAGITPDMPVKDKLKALKGLTFGMTRPGAVTQLFIQYQMKQAGLDGEKDATFVQVGGGQALVAAVKAGKIDGFMLSAPAPYMLEKDGVGVVVVKNSAGEGLAEFKDFAFETICVLKSYAEAHPDIVKGYVTSLNEALAWTKQNPAEALEILQTYFPDTDAETLKISFEATVPAIAEGGRLSAAAVKNQLAVLKAVGAIAEVPDAAEGVLWSNEYNP